MQPFSVTALMILLNVSFIHAAFVSHKMEPTIRENGPILMRHQPPNHPPMVEHWNVKDKGIIDRRHENIFRNRLKQQRHILMPMQHRHLGPFEGHFTRQERPPFWLNNGASQNSNNQRVSESENPSKITLRFEKKMTTLTKIPNAINKVKIDKTHPEINMRKSESQPHVEHKHVIQNEEKKNKQRFDNKKPQLSRDTNTNQLARASHKTSSVAQQSDQNDHFKTSKHLIARQPQQRPVFLLPQPLMPALNRQKLHLMLHPLFGPPMPRDNRVFFPMNLPNHMFKQNVQTAPQGLHSHEPMRKFHAKSFNKDVALHSQPFQSHNIPHHVRNNENPAHEKENNTQRPVGMKKNKATKESQHVNEAEHSKSKFKKSQRFGHQISNTTRAQLTHDVSKHSLISSTNIVIDNKIASKNENKRSEQSMANKFGSKDKHQKSTPFYEIFENHDLKMNAPHWHGMLQHSPNHDHLHRPTHFPGPKEGGDRHLLQQNSHLHLLPNGPPFHSSHMDSMNKENDDNKGFQNNADDLTPIISGNSSWQKRNSWVNMLLNFDKNGELKIKVGGKQSIGEPIDESNLDEQDRSIVNEINIDETSNTDDQNNTPSTPATELPEIDFESSITDAPDSTAPKENLINGVSLNIKDVTQQRNSKTQELTSIAPTVSIDDQSSSGCPILNSSCHLKCSGNLYKLSVNTGCPTCNCCPKVVCHNKCTNGFDADDEGCPTCDCIEK